MILDAGMYGPTLLNCKSIPVSRRSSLEAYEFEQITSVSKSNNGLSLKQMTPTQGHQDSKADASRHRQPNLKSRYHEFECEHASKDPTTIDTEENDKMVEDLVVQDRGMSIRQIVEDTGRSHHAVYNIITTQFNMKKLSSRSVILG